MYKVKKWQSSGELNWSNGFQGPLPKVGKDSLEDPLLDRLYWGRKFRRWDRLKSVPTPRKPLSGTPTAQIGGREKKVLMYVSLILPRYAHAHFKDNGDNKRRLIPMFVQSMEKWQISGELNWP